MIASASGKSWVRRMFVSQKVVVDWNQLPEYFVDAPSTNAFKTRPDRYWRDHMGI